MCKRRDVVETQGGTLIPSNQVKVALDFMEICQSKDPPGIVAIPSVQVNDSLAAIELPKILELCNHKTGMFSDASTFQHLRRKLKNINIPRHRSGSF